MSRNKPKTVFLAAKVPLLLKQILEERAAAAGRTLSAQLRWELGQAAIRSEGQSLGEAVR
jgi:hypothetical protein